MGQSCPFFIQDLSNESMIYSTFIASQPQFSSLLIVMFAHSMFPSDFYLKGPFHLAIVYSIKFDIFVIL